MSQNARRLGRLVDHVHVVHEAKTTDASEPTAGKIKTMAGPAGMPELSSSRNTRRPGAHAAVRPSASSAQDQPRLLHRAGITDQPPHIVHDILTKPAGTLTAEQLAFVETFGYLTLPGLVTDLLPAIEAAFSEIWDVGPDGLPRRAGDNTVELHDDSKRSYIVPFIDQVSWTHLSAFFGTFAP
eukprot:SAG31_NODE_3505_length_4187_cov_2.714286_7_plen_183_part_00